jgi:hypothetical protein
MTEGFRPSVNLERSKTESLSADRVAKSPMVAVWFLSQLDP